VTNDSLTTAHRLLNKTATEVQAYVNTATLDKPSAKPTHQQVSLSRFFAGVKKVKVDIPDDLVLYTRIPNDFYSSVKHIKPLLCDSDNSSMTDETGLERRMYYREIDDMMECVELLNNELGGEDMDGKTESQIEGLLVDPPWEFIIEDGRNDGSCKWDAKQVVSDIQEGKPIGADAHVFSIHTGGTTGQGIRTYVCRTHFYLDPQAHSGTRYQDDG
jgi:hypothetical protein